jgi:hypothetical protein
MVTTVPADVVGLEYSGPIIGRGKEVGKAAASRIFW